MLDGSLTEWQEKPPKHANWKRKSRTASPFCMQFDHILSVRKKKQETNKIKWIHSYLNWQQFKCYNSNRHVK